MKKIWLAVGMLFWVLLATSAMADSWLPPSVRTYASADGTWKLNIYPRELTNQLDYFQDKVDGKPNAGGIPGDSRKSTTGHMERRHDGHWRSEERRAGEEDDWTCGSRGVTLHHKKKE